MSTLFSDETDEDSYGSCDRCDTSSSSVSYDARYIYRLQQASKHLASTETHFYRNKVPLLEKIDRRCLSLSMDLIAANDTVFSYKFDDHIAMDNLLWTLRFFPYQGHSYGQYMLELSVQSEMVEYVNWHAEVRIKVTLGGNVLAPLPKFNHPVSFSSQSPSLIIFVVDFPTVKAWPSGLVQVEVYPQSVAGLTSSGPLFSKRGDPGEVAIHVQNGADHRIFYVERRWVEEESEYIQEYLSSEFATGTQEVDIKNVSPRHFLLLLRAMERFEEHEMFHPEKIEILLDMIDKFQAVHLQCTVSKALEDTPYYDLETKLKLADKYFFPWPVIERLLRACDPFAIRRSSFFNQLSLKLREEIKRRTSFFPSAIATRFPLSPLSDKSFLS